MIRSLSAIAGAAALALVVSVAPAQATSARQTPNPGLSSVDDFHTHPAYAKFYDQKLRWDACLDGSGNDIGGEDVECAIALAPLNWADASAGEIRLFLIRTKRPAGAPRAPRLLLANPGGPGIAGGAMSTNIAYTLGLLDTHDSVTVNPRGINPLISVRGETQQATYLNCGPMRPGTTSSPSSDVTTFTREDFRARARSMEAHYTQCFDRHAALASQISSPATARDFNLIRHVLGYASADYYGTSYGTWLGSIYSRMFPTTVDRVILNANMDWQSGSFSTGFNYQTQSFQLSFDQAFLPWLARHHSTYRLGSTSAQVEAGLAELRRQAMARGVPGSYFDVRIMNTQTGGPRAFPTIAHELAQLASGAVQPEPKLVAMLKDVTVFADDGFQAVRCNDTGNAGTAQEAADRAFARTRIHPVFTLGAYLNTDCTGWPAAPQATPELMQRPLGKVLMVQTENDPNTMYRGALATRRSAPGTARMVLQDDGHGHGIDLRDPCIRAHAVGLLRDGVFPANDAHCQAGPMPEEREIYEFNVAASPEKPLVEMAEYGVRTLTPPPLDADATATWQAAHPPVTPAPSRRESAVEEVLRRFDQLDPRRALRF